MIAWDAFVTYILKPTVNIKLIVLSIFASSFLLRRTSMLQSLQRSSQKLSTKKMLFAVLLLAFSVRLFWVLWSPHIPPASITEDGHMWRQAQELAAGKGFRWVEGEYTARRPVGYPFFLSMLVRIFGPRLLIAELFQVLFCTINVYLLYFIGKKIRSELFGISVAFIYAFYPTAVMSVKLLMDEHLFMLLWLWGICFLIDDYQVPSYKKLSLASLIIGVSAYFRTYSALTPPAVFLAWFLGKKSGAEAFKRGILSMVIILLCAVPWGVRNYYRLGTFVPYTALLGWHLYYSNNPTADIRYPVNPDLAHGGDPEFLSAKTDVERDYAGRHAAWRWIKKNPSLFLQKALARAFYMHGLNREGWVVDDNFTTLKPERQMPSPKFLKNLHKTEQYYYVTVFWFAVVGFVLLCSNWVKNMDSRGFIYILLILSIYIVFTAIALNHRKYRFVIEPFFCILAVEALRRAFSPINTKHS